VTGVNEFSNNGTVGLEAYAARDITLYNATANLNGSQGLVLVSYGNIALSNVVATENNADDIYLFTPGNATTNIAHVGTLDATAVCGTLVLNGVVASTIRFPVSGIHTFVDEVGNVQTIYCDPKIYVDGQLLGASPVVTAQYEFDLSCDSQTLYPRELPNGDKVTIVCPVSGRALISRLDNTTIPADLPASYTYASAFSVDILQAGEPIPVITEGGYIEVSFQVPSQQSSTYSILFWDKDRWIPLNDFIGPENSPQHFDLNPGIDTDLRQVWSGVQMVTKNGVQRVEVSTNFPGIFVLAQH
jgi:hypothetical protein